MSQNNKKGVKANRSRNREVPDNKENSEENSIFLQDDMTYNVNINIISKIESENMESKEVYALYQSILKIKDDLIEAKNVIIRELNYKVSLLEEKIENFNKTNLNENNTNTFASMVQKEKANDLDKHRKELLKKNVINNANVLIIKPTKPQANATTRKEVSKYLNPMKLNVDIRKIQDLRDGAVKIVCENKEERDKIQEEACKTLDGQKYVVNSQRKLNPRIKIIGIDYEMTENELKESILERNSFISNLNMKLIV